jgi:hypothetical protein
VIMSSVLTRQQRAEMLHLYVAGKSGGWLARKFGVSESYPRWLAHKRGFRREQPVSQPQSEKPARTCEEVGALQWLSDRLDGRFA